MRSTVSVLMKLGFIQDMHHIPLPSVNLLEIRLNDQCHLGEGKIEWDQK